MRFRVRCTDQAETRPKRAERNGRPGPLHDGHETRTTTTEQREEEGPFSGRCEHPVVSCEQDLRHEGTRNEVNGTRSPASRTAMSRAD